MTGRYQFLRIIIDPEAVPEGHYKIGGPRMLLPEKPADIAKEILTVEITVHDKAGAEVIRTEDHGLTEVP